MSDMMMSRIKDYCNVEKGKIGIKKAVLGKYPLVTTAAERLTHNEYHFDKPAVIIPVVSSTGHGHASLKRIHYQEGKFAVGSILCAVTPKDENILSANYLYHFLDVYKEKLLVSRMKGMANVTLPLTEIANVEFPLLSIEKQREWVALFEQTSQYSGRITSEISKQQSLLQSLRQSILQDAISGKLTAKWRKANPTVETARALLVKIQTEKERLIEKNKIKKYKPYSALQESEIPFELPRSWVWCRLDELSVKITDGTHHSPTNTQYGDYQYITAKNIKDNGIDRSKITYVSERIHKEIYKRCNPERGDILFIKDGATTGVVTANQLDEQFSMLSSVALIKLPKLLNNWYVIYAMRSPYYYEATRKDMYGVAITRVTLNKIKKSFIPLPPKKELDAIVSQVNNLLATCDKLEKKISKSQLDSSLLLQAVLKESFQ